MVVTLLFFLLASFESCIMAFLILFTDREKQIKTENNRGTFMSRGQKAALLLSYWELRDHVDVKDWADELIQEGVLEPQNREVLDRTFSRYSMIKDYVLFFKSRC